jgi:hypothetical protein
MMRPAFYSAVRAVGTDPAHSPMLHCCDSFGAAFAFAQVEASFIIVTARLQDMADR